MKIPTYAWVLPRPRRDKFAGGFPLHFENKLIKLLDNPKSVFHPFGGKAEHGIRMDLKREYSPDLIGDAHNIPIRDNTFDCVILDPPYSDEYAKRLFGTPPIKLKTYLKEAMRITKQDGFLVFYHIHPIPVPRGCRWYARILLENRQWHKLRWVGIFRKGYYGDQKNDLSRYT